MNRHCEEAQPTKQSIFALRRKERWIATAASRECAHSRDAASQ
jgi:hypothetical protein